MATISPLRKKRTANNFRFALGTGSDFTDLDKKWKYMIHEYYEQMNNPDIPKSKKPTKIRVTDLEGKKTLEWLEPEIIEERMKDPEPDPRYLPEPVIKGKW